MEIICWTKRASLCKLITKVDHLSSLRSSAQSIRCVWAEAARNGDRDVLNIFNDHIQCVGSELGNIIPVIIAKYWGLLAAKLGG